MRTLRTLRTLKLDRTVCCLMLSLFVTGMGELAAQQDGAEEHFRTFRDRSGREVVAKVVEVLANRVTIQREDGRKFTVGIDLLSENDQQFLRAHAAFSGAPGETSEQPVVDTTDDEVWSRFRGPTGMGVSTAKGLPLQWSPDENVRWKIDLPGSGTSSPIVFGDQIYVTTYTGYLVPGEERGTLEELKRHLVALDRESGQIKWDRAIAAELPEEENIRDHGYAANTPVADASGVYVFFGKTGVIAFDHDGNQRWKADVGSKTHGWGSGASLLLHNGLLIVNASVESESLIALDPSNGSERWKVDQIREAWNTPIVVTSESGREELIVSRHGDVLAFDPITGDSLWNCKTDITWYMVPTAVAADGIVYVLGGRSGTAGLAVRAGGSGDVTDANRLWTSKSGTNVPSPIYLDGHLYWVSHDGGIAYCAKAESGELVYEERLSRFGQSYASPILADGRIYYFDRGGKTVVVPAKPEFEILATSSLKDGSRFDASPTVDGNRILVRSGKSLYCLAKSES